MSACAPAGTLLGQTTEYVDTYRPDLLTPIPRSLGRDVIGVHDFCGTDVWRLYEITWINERGLPVAAAGEIRVPATSPCIVESKSLKLYIGSLTQTKIASVEEAARLIARDVSACVGAPVEVLIDDLARWEMPVTRVPGIVLEAECGDLECSVYEPDASLLKAASDEVVEETLSSNLLRSRCPVTGQPDHASIVISYHGRRIDRRALLAYIVSFRRHQGFHEQCCEQIHADIMRVLAPEALSVNCCFTRRGGIDISPFRSTVADPPDPVIRTPRQ